MQEFLSYPVLGNKLGTWIFATLIMLGSILVARSLYWFFRNYLKIWARRSNSKIDDVFVDIFETPLSLAIVIGGIWYASDSLILSEKVDVFSDKIFYILIIFTFAWLLVRLIDTIIQNYLMPYAQVNKKSFSDQILPLVRKFAKLSIWTIAIIIGVENAGYNVGALLAGLGIGGLALALAAKDTVSNFFGGLTIFLDKPFSIKDRIIISDIDGFVEDIGIRSTRIRKLDGRLVTLPNSSFINGNIENITSEHGRRIALNIGLTYDTTPEKVEEALAILKDIAMHSQGLQDFHRISFNQFGDFSLNINFVYFIDKPAEISDVQTDVNLQILRRFNAAGLQFAFPTQTIYNHRVPSTPNGNNQAPA